MYEGIDTMLHVTQTHELIRCNIDPEYLKHSSCTTPSQEYKRAYLNLKSKGDYIAMEVLPIDDEAPGCPIPSSSLTNREEPTDGEIEISKLLWICPFDHVCVC